MQFLEKKILLTLNFWTVVYFYEGAYAKLSEICSGQAQVC